MRTNHKYILGAFIMLSSLVSCSNDNIDEATLDDAQEEYVTISLSPDGDNLSRASSPNDVYGINIFYDKDKDGVCETHYGYGLFNNKDAMTVTLISSYRYKFVCTLVKDAVNKLYCGSGNLMAYPFQTNSSITKYVENKFNYGDSEYLTGLGSGKSHLASTTSPTRSNCKSNPQTDRYYGERNDYSPKTGERVTVEMKRTVYGAKFIISGVAEGEAGITCGSFSKSTRVDYESEEYIYTYEDVYNCWLKEPYETKSVNLRYISDRSSYWDFSKSQDINFKRNVMTTVYVNVDPDLSGGILNIQEEPMGENNIITVGLDTNGLLDIVVDPTEEQ